MAEGDYDHLTVEQQRARLRDRIHAAEAELFDGRLALAEQEAAYPDTGGEGGLLGNTRAEVERVERRLAALRKLRDDLDAQPA